MVREHMKFNFMDSMSKAKKNYARLLEPLCREWNLTRNEMDILLFLYNNPEYDRAADIVTVRGIAKSHVSVSVNDLENRGFLLRENDPHDRRAVHLRMTDQARSIAAEAAQQQRLFFSQLYAGIKPEELQAWKAIMERVSENIYRMEID